MEISIRKNHELRMKAFDLLQELKSKNMAREEIVNKIHDEYGIPKAAIFSWYSRICKPHGRKGEITYKPELF